LGRFTQADSLVPGVGDPQALNRYAYGNNNPIRYSDPSGHLACDEAGNCVGSGGMVVPEKFGWPSPAHKASRPNKPIINDKDDNKADNSGESGDYDKLTEAFYTVKNLLNWSLSTPGEVTIYETPGYIVIGGTRVFYQPFYTLDNGSLMTIGPSSMSLGPMSFNIKGGFSYKQGLNSIDAIRLHLPWNFQPWAVKMAMDTTLKVGMSKVTNRIGFEFTARPDKIAYVPEMAIAGYLVYKGLTTGQMPFQQEWQLLGVTQ
jgi:hypothetical protein